MSAIEKLIGRVKHSDPTLYRSALEEMHILKFGEHYDEDMARAAVAVMTGSEEPGEHWNIDQVIRLTQPHTMLFGACDTIWDAYVAMNMWWHDLGVNYTKRGLGEAEMAEDAVTWAFCDDDAPEGKIWKHIHAMI